MALGMYTVLPGVEKWDEESTGWLTPCLPLVGLLLGLLWLGIAAVAAAFMPRLLGAAAVMLGLPVLTGFLHLDGFMDVSDALLSSRPREEKLRILKDPHTGAFAVASLGCLLALTLGALHGVLDLERSLAPFLFVPIVSRSLAALTLMKVRPLTQSIYGTMAYSTATAGKRLFCTICLAVALFGSFAFGRGSGAACMAAVLGYAAAGLAAIRSLGGMNGDIAGFSICVAEAAAMVSLNLIA